MRVRDVVSQEDRDAFDDGVAVTLVADERATVFDERALVARAREEVERSLGEEWRQAVVAAFALVVFFALAVVAFFALAAVAAVLRWVDVCAPNFFVKRSTRPSVSISFWRPVKNGWQAEHISRCSSGFVERVLNVFPHAQRASTS